ncbi:hypothetical protein FH972_018765 [Carpinus fangiana]|uniref:RecQ-mediated genome instability protein 1 n=1 Tax=Carpinus fangiana TaxID=176857 RepID=A0A5N6RRK4_9ROSI|nr:hypothetical protein FH972_018765 [Carpinus fangiana]
MLRRRLRLTCSSDDEDENPNPNPNPDPDPSEPVAISDDDENGDFIDVLDNFIPSSPPPAPASEPVAISDNEENGDFINASDNFTPPSPPHPPAQPDPVNSTGQGSDSRSGFPVGDSLLRLGLSLKTEWLDACLNSLPSSVPASLDVAVKAKLCFERFLTLDMNLCGNGVLPPNVDSMHLVDLPGPYVLQVDEIVNITCPLKGRYEKAPPGVKRCLKLSMTDGVQRVFGMEYRPIQALEVLAPAGLKVAICNVHIRHGLLMLVPEAFEVLGGLVEELEAARQRLVDEINKPPRGKRTRTGVIPPLATRATHAAWPSNGANTAGHNNSSTLQDATASQRNNQGATWVPSGGNTSQRTTYQNTSQSTTEESRAPATVGNAAPSTSSSVIMGFEEMHIDTVPFSRENTVTNQSYNIVSDVEDIQMVDEVDHPVILSGDREIPFTYLASLSAKMAAMKEKSHSVQGKIKCFLTGVKGFQYKQRRTYELRVYVDDGSLISEILIDHDVIGDMKDTLKQFQIFLANFEGTMLIEMNENSSLPIAIEMNQGCPESDAWLLLRRLKSTIHSQTPHQFPLDPIDVSP